MLKGAVILDMVKRDKANCWKRRLPEQPSTIKIEARHSHNSTQMTCVECSGTWMRSSPNRICILESKTCSWGMQSSLATRYIKWTILKSIRMFNATRFLNQNKSIRNMKMAWTTKRGWQKMGGPIHKRRSSVSLQHCKAAINCNILRPKTILVWTQAEEHHQWMMTTNWKKVETNSLASSRTTLDRYNIIELQF